LGGLHQLDQHSNGRAVACLGIVAAQLIAHRRNRVTGRFHQYIRQPLLECFLPHTGELAAQ
jgi:hypothetical protein